MQAFSCRGLWAEAGNCFHRVLLWAHASWERPKKPRFDTLPDDPCVDDLVSAMGSGVNLIEVVRRARKMSETGRGGLGVECSRGRLWVPTSQQLPSNLSSKHVADRATCGMHARLRVFGMTGKHMDVRYLAALGSGQLANIERDAFRRLDGLYGSTLRPMYFNVRGIGLDGCPCPVDVAALPPHEVFGELARCNREHGKLSLRVCVCCTPGRKVQLLELRLRYVIFRRGDI